LGVYRFPIFRGDGQRVQSLVVFEVGRELVRDDKKGTLHPLKGPDANTHDNLIPRDEDGGSDPLKLEVPSG
jgi:hypothetical protein